MILKSRAKPSPLGCGAVWAGIVFAAAGGLIQVALWETLLQEFDPNAVGSSEKNELFWYACVGGILLCHIGIALIILGAWKIVERVRNPPAD